MSEQLKQLEASFRRGAISLNALIRAFRDAGEPIPGVRYSSNNSGGKWWLSDDDWRALEESGWVVEWRPERWLGTLAIEAFLPFATLGGAEDSFALATGQDVNAHGCSCCGSPHYFTTENRPPDTLPVKD
jgi:hypothetical protein